MTNVLCFETSSNQLQFNFVIISLMSGERGDYFVTVEDTRIPTQTDVEELDKAVLILDLARKTGGILVGIGITAFSGSLALLNSEVGNEKVASGIAVGGLFITAIGGSTLVVAQEEYRRIKKDIRNLGLKTKATFLSLRVEKNNYQPTLID